MTDTYRVYSTHVRMWSGRMDEDSYQALNPCEFDDFIRNWIVDDETKIMGIKDFEHAQVTAPDILKVKVHTDKNSNVWMSTTVVIEMVHFTNATLREINVFKLKNPTFDGWIEPEIEDVDG